MTADRVGDATILDGFTETAGLGEGGLADTAGAGMIARSSDSTVSNIAFACNKAYNGGGVFHYGGASILLEVTFTGSQAINDGGGMYATSPSKPTLTDVTFTSNQAGGRRGGLGRWASRVHAWSGDQAQQYRAQRPARMVG